jgi:putative transposase
MYGTRALRARRSRPKRTQQFLFRCGAIQQHFALKRHLLRVSLYLKQLAGRFVAWLEFTKQATNPPTGF